MDKIKLLDPNLINQIAAGEVIERPNSVVKELVENSIDAGATQIFIEIDNGGKDKIAIIDNGEGMSIQDAQNSIIKHATSKIKSKQDLFNIYTMGFRGEALASIASISKLTIITKNSTHTGSKFYIENSKVVEKSDFPRESGTSIIVENLFYNTPARLKFLKDNYLENSHIIKTIQNYCLVYPEIDFELRVNGKIQIKSPSSDFKNNAVSIYSSDIVKGLLEVEGQIDYEHDNEISKLRVHGLISKPRITRQNKNEINIFFNKRPVKNYIVDRAITDAYHNLLFNKSHPICILNIEIDPELIDVNVHPQKREIRVKCEKEIYDLVYNACRSSLENNNLTPDVQFKKDQRRLDGSVVEKKIRKEFKYESMNSNFDLGNKPGEIIKTESQDALHLKKDIKERYNADLASSQEEITTFEQEDDFDYSFDSNYSVGANKDFMGVNDHLYSKLSSVDDYEKEFLKYINTKNFLDKKNNYIPQDKINVIGQFHNAFILAQDNKGLLIIDQHVAEERYFYEKYMEEYFKKDISVQKLLNPIVVNLTPEEFNFSINNLDKFEQLGIELEEFGDKCLKIKTLPLIFDRLQDKNFFFAILEDIQKETIFATNRKKNKHLFQQQHEDDQNYNLIDEIKEKIITKMACMNSLKAGQQLTLTQMQRIVDKWNSTKNKESCPHGRPIQIRLNFGDLWKQFKRDG